MIAGIILGFLVTIVLIYAWNNDAFTPVVALIAVPFLIYSCASSDAYKAKLEADKKEAAALAIPHVIREVDGCKVYEFSEDFRMHWFTKCGDKTTTETPLGKGRVEIVITEVAK